MKKSAFALVCAFSALAASSHAVLLFSFESGNQGFYNPNWSTGDTVLSESTTGATEGSKSLKIARPAAGNGFRWIVADNVASGVKFDLRNATRVSLDVTTGTDFGASNWFKMMFVISQAAWNQTTEIDVAVTPGTRTVEFNIATIAANIDPTGWMRVGFSINSDAGSATTLYVDNLRSNAVPEPGTLLALGVGAAALLRRRARTR